MFLTILLIMILAYAGVNVFTNVGFNVMDVPGIVWGSVRGAYKAVIHFLVGVSILTILSYLLNIGFMIKFIGWLLFILSIDIVTPPYGIDIETLFAFPLGAFLETAWNLSFGWALAIAYLIVFGLAIGYLCLWWFVLRKHDF